MPEQNAKTSVDERIAESYRDVLMQGLAAPLDPSAAAVQTRASAVALFQAGVYRHKLLLIKEILERFDAHRAPSEPVNAFFEHSGASGSRTAADVEHYYRLALILLPAFAEARYNLAILRARAGAVDEALRLLWSASEVPPHPRALPHAQLSANALWHIARLYRGSGKDEAAASAYGRALAQLGNFGVDHSSVAEFLRRRGNLDESAMHFERVMAYSHLYAPQFVEPNYDERERLPNGPDGRPVDPLMATPVDWIAGVGRVLYWWHLYILERDDAPRASVERSLRRWVALGVVRRRLLGVRAKFGGRRSALCAATSLDGLKKLLQVRSRLA
jgi:tetratricopeptide (TPR) repeat protein